MNTNRRTFLSVTVGIIAAPFLPAVASKSEFYSNEEIEKAWESARKVGYSRCRLEELDFRERHQDLIRRVQQMFKTNPACFRFDEALRQNLRRLQSSK